MNALSNAARERRQLFVRWTLIVVGFVSVAAVAYELQVRGVFERWKERLLATAPADSAVTEKKEDAAVDPSEVKITDDKANAAGLKESAAVVQPVRDSRTVPGSVTYDANKLLELTAPVELVVTRVLVEPGQAVEAGARLAILSSAEIGLARDEVMKREADLDLVRKELAWDEVVAANVEKTLELFREKPTMTALEKQLADRPLGDYREKLLGSYSRLVLAETVLSGSDALDGTGAISRRSVDERRSAKEVASATFLSACETARFAANREREKTQAEVFHAERLLKISRERLTSLLGPQGSLSDGSQPALTEFVVTTPFAGRVQERHVVNASRVAIGKPLFTIADTSTLWVSAEIHERDWRALDVAVGSRVTVRVPALDNAEFPVEVRFLGSHVTPETRALPLVAELKNPHGKFRPGLFVWVDVPLENERSALVVPPGAIMRHENRPFVFVPIDATTFRRVDVQTGLEMRDGIEILAGLTAGQRVVSHGSFFLKSELLLERETD